MKKEYILFIDSGVGGLSTLAESMQHTLAHYIYFADNLHSPYGDHSSREIFEYLKCSIEDLTKKYQIRLVVLACNTATTSCIFNLRKYFKNLVFVGTEPALRLASKSGAESVLCLATPTTAKQVRFISLKNASSAKVCSLAIGSLAMDIESFLIVPSYFAKLRLLRDVCKIIFAATNFDAVVLGCTHYVLILNLLKKYISKPIFDGNFGVAKQIARKFASPCKNFKSSAKIILSDSQKQPVQNYRKILNQILAKE